MQVSGGVFLFLEWDPFYRHVDEEVTKRPLVSWFYVHNAKGSGVYAQRYLTGKVECTNLVRETKTLDFTVGTDGNECNKNKNLFCNGKLQADKNFR